MSHGELDRSLGPLMIWGLGVGYVISGMYFGWNLGLPAGGPYGFLIATLLVTLMYVTFVMCYAELSCALPKAGGAFVYCTRGLGHSMGFIGGIAQWIEFVFAPPAIAAAIGAYFSLFFPSVPQLFISLIAYFLFTGLNIYGVRMSAIFELIMTSLAVIELLIFIGFVSPHFSFVAFSLDPFPTGWTGIFKALPFAIWFYLGIEGLANVAEESENPQRDIGRGFMWAMGTLVFLALFIFFGAVGVGGWKSAVYPEGSFEASDSPLPLALGLIVGKNNLFYHLLVSIGLFGLIASFHGIILASGRALLELGRAGLAPAIVGNTLEKRHTPAAALITNMTVGILALLTGRTGEIITLSVFGALTLYVLSLLAFFRLRQREPELERPFKTPFYPWTPGISLALAILCLICLCIFHAVIAFVYGGLLALAMVYYHFSVRGKNLNLGEDPYARDSVARLDYD